MLLVDTLQNELQIVRLGKQPQWAQLLVQEIWGSIVGNIGQNTLLTNGRGDELESDEQGVLFMVQSVYYPYEMIKVMEILKEAGGPNRTPEFQSTHPDPENRIQKIKEAIAKYKNQG
jgi:predicted Zn-dependent protease